MTERIGNQHRDLLRHGEGLGRSGPPAESPEGSRPNVLMVVLDDVGFAQLGCFGGEIDSPIIDGLAGGGLRYTNFHATPICSSSRAALLSGRNPHAAGIGSITDWANGYANTAGLTKHTMLLPEMLEPAGYSTLAVGKWHLDSPRNAGAAGPFDNWPVRRGFGRYYGFLGGCTDYFHPDLVEDNHFVAPFAGGEENGYHLTTDLVDRSIRYLRDVKSASPARKPFFMYLALGTAHAPLQAPREYIDRYRGRFDRGWDASREETFRRQLENGIIPPGTQLPDRSEGVPAWDSLPADQQALYARMQEVFAGTVTHADAELGRLFAFLSEIEELDDTIVILVSDNGASFEGRDHGSDNHFRQMNGIFDQPADLYDSTDHLGSELAAAHYPKGWSMAGNTPLRYWKRYSHGGGVRVPMVMRYPAGIKEPGGVRNQFHFLTDVIPTVLDFCDVEMPSSFHGCEQLPLHGVSMRPSMERRESPTPREAQYFEVLGNRAIWQNGWKAVSVRSSGDSLQDDTWELFHLDEDFSESTDLAGKEPALLRRMVDRWWVEAGRYGVLPVDGRNWEGRPLAEMYHTQRLDLFQDCSPINTRIAPHIINRSYEIVAEIERASTEDSGVLVALGGRFLGYSLYVLENHLVHDYNYFGTHSILRSSEPLPMGRVQVRYRFDRTGDLSGVGSLWIEGREVGRLELSATAPRHMGLEPLECGRDTQTPVSPEYASPFAFSARIRSASICLVDEPLTAPSHS